MQSGWGGVVGEEGEVFPHVAAVAWNSARLKMMHSHFSFKIAAALIYLVGGFHPVSRSQDHCEHGHMVHLYHNNLHTEESNYGRSSNTGVTIYCRVDDIKSPLHCNHIIH